MMNATLGAMRYKKQFRAAKKVLSNAAPAKLMRNSDRLIAHSRINFFFICKLSKILREKISRVYIGPKTAMSNQIFEFLLVVTSDKNCQHGCKTML